MGAAQVGRAVCAEVADPCPGGDVIREIEDPATGNRWQFRRNPGHHGGPGILVLLGSAGRGGIGQVNAEAAIAPSVAPPVIRAGDELEIEEHTAVVDVRLSAVALEPAERGALFHARLKVGGSIVSVVAVSPGHALFAQDAGAAKP